MGEVRSRSPRIRCTVPSNLTNCAVRSLIAEPYADVEITNTDELHGEIRELGGSLEAEGS